LSRGRLVHRLKKFASGPGRAAADIKGQATQRVICKVAANEHDPLADISTLADP
jgi:hypothetical protein